MPLKQTLKNPISTLRSHLGSSSEHSSHSSPATTTTNSQLSTAPTTNEPLSPRQSIAHDGDHRPRDNEPPSDEALARAASRDGRSVPAVREERGDGVQHVAATGTNAGTTVGTEGVKERDFQQDQTEDNIPLNQDGNPVPKKKNSLFSNPFSRSGTNSGSSTPARSDSIRTNNGNGLLGKAKSITAGAPGRSLAHPPGGSGVSSILGGGKHKDDHAKKREGRSHAEKVRRKKEEKRKRRAEVEARLEKSGEGKGGKWAKMADPESKYRNETFGFYPLMQSDPKATDKFDYIDMKDIKAEDVGKRVTVRARIDHVRPHSAKLAFIVLRYQMQTMSAVIAVPDALHHPVQPRSRDHSVPGHGHHSQGHSSPRHHHSDHSIPGSPHSHHSHSRKQSEGMPLNKAVADLINESHGSELSRKESAKSASSVGSALSSTVGSPLNTDGQTLTTTGTPGSSELFHTPEFGAATGETGPTPLTIPPPQANGLAPPLPLGNDITGQGSASMIDSPVATIGESSLRSKPSHQETLATALERSTARTPDDASSEVFSDDTSSIFSSSSSDYDSEYDEGYPEAAVSEDFVRWVEHLRMESLVHVTGTLQRPQNATGRIEEASSGLHEIEMRVDKMFVIGRAFDHAPFQLGSIEGHKVATEEEKKTGQDEEQQRPEVSVRQELANRVFDLRAPSNQAIFKIRAAVCKIFREYLDNQGFIEIQTAKIQGAATEGGASVFKLDYFGRPAYLAQSPQLAKQQAIIADFGRVYEVGSVFRAENSNTMRHLTEFFGLDLEMAIDTDYHECMHIIDGVLKAIFKGIQQTKRAELEIVKQRFPHEDLVIPDETVVLHYSEGVRLLREAGVKHEDGTNIQDDEDFDTPTEKRLGAIVKEKYNTDYYILDKFPAGVRPFYTMPDPTDDRWSNSFDIFLRGQEILSGGQRIHDAKMLESRMKAQGMDPESLGEYTQAFRLGAPPHAGGGIGLERIIMLMLQLGNVRFASMYPRDPKSFPDSGKPPPAPRPKLGRQGTLPLLEDLIAAYGDSTNTSWIDPRYKIWRHHATGAAIGYVPAKHNYGVIWGDPLCAKEDTPQVLQAWLEHCDHIKLKPIWCCVNKRTAEFLKEKYRWKGLGCVSEARVDPRQYEGTEDSNVAKKIQQAKKAGVKVISVEGELSDELKDRVDARIKDWQSHREGEQVHITDVLPWLDPKHRKYFYAQDKEGNIAGLEVLAQLSPEHGQQIKWSLQFPGAPGGTSEYLLSEVMQYAVSKGVKTLTFGASAASELKPIGKHKGASFKFLAGTYETIVKKGNLLNKTDFRRKFDLHEEPLFVSYPKNGLGAHGISAIMETIREPGSGKSEKATKSW